MCEISKSTNAPEAKKTHWSGQTAGRNITPPATRNAGNILEKLNTMLRNKDLHRRVNKLLREKKLQKKVKSDVRTDAQDVSVHK